MFLVAPGLSENMISPIGHVHYNDTTTCVKRLILHWLFLVLKRRSKRWWSVAVELVGEGVRGGKLVRVIHGKHAGMQRISSINP